MYLYVILNIYLNTEIVLFLATDNEFMISFWRGRAWRGSVKTA